MPPGARSNVHAGAHRVRRRRRALRQEPVRPAARARPRASAACSSRPRRRSTPRCTRASPAHRADARRRLSHPRRAARAARARSSAWHSQRDDVVVVDCLTLWLSNLLLRGDDARADPRAQVDALARRCSSARVPRRASSPTRSGIGLVPETPLGRAFRDLRRPRASAPRRALPTRSTGRCSAAAARAARSRSRSQPPEITDEPARPRPALAIAEPSARSRPRGAARCSTARPSRARSLGPARGARLPARRDARRRRARRCRRKAIVVMAADHGVADEGVAPIRRRSPRRCCSTSRAAAPRSTCSRARRGARRGRRRHGRRRAPLAPRREHPRSRASAAGTRNFTREPGDDARAGDPRRSRPASRLAGELAAAA